MPNWEVKVWGCSDHDEGDQMIILMDGLYNDISVGENKYEGVSRTTWQCYLKLFRWLFEEGAGVPQLFQTGWAIQIDGRGEE